MTQATVTWEQAKRFRGANVKGHELFFDTSVKGGGMDTAGSPMEAVLEASAACTGMDIVNIVTKRRKQIAGLRIDLTAERATTEPMVFTEIHMDVHLTSPDATLSELCSAMELSWDKYCNVSIMLMRSGVAMSWTAHVITPTGEMESITRAEYRSQKIAKEAVAQ